MLSLIIEFQISVYFFLTIQILEAWLSNEMLSIKSAFIYYSILQTTQWNIYEKKKHFKKSKTSIFNTVEKRE